VACPYSNRTLLSISFSDDWMKKNGFLDGENSAEPKSKGSNGVKREAETAHKSTAEDTLFQFGEHKVKDLKLPKAVTVTLNAPCSEAAKIMEQNHFDQLPVVSDKKKNSCVGLITLGNILSKVAHGRALITDPVSKVMFKFDKTKQFEDITANTHLRDLTKFFDHHPAAVVTERLPSGEMEVKHVLTKIDLVKFLVKTGIPGSPTKKRKA
jgi:cystathionine beta-synthase